MATAIFWKPKGKKTTTIDGSVEVKNHEKKIAADNFSHGISGPMSGTPGRISGPRQHQSIALSCVTDKAFPTLMKVLVTNEILDSVVIEFTDTNDEGVDEVFQTITLTEAAIDNISYNVSGQHSGGDTYSIMLSYRKIEMEWKDGNIKATDDLNDPNIA